MTATSVQVLPLGVLAAALAATGVWIVLRTRRTPAERERRRRLLVGSHGRVVDGTVTELRDQMLFYAYEVRGVEYSASQDISVIARLLPADPSEIIGHVSVKYLPRVPANSIVISENWSGLRAALQEAKVNSETKETM